MKFHIVVPKSGLPGIEPIGIFNRLIKSWTTKSISVNVNFLPVLAFNPAGIPYPLMLIGLPFLST